MKSVIDGRVICISTPRGKEGIFYELYKNAENVDHRFMMRAPTWVVNPNLPKHLLLSESPDMTDMKFAMEYGGEFFGTAGESFFSPDDVERVFRNHHLPFVNHGVPGITYFAHLDPATSSHNYALVITHQEERLDRETNKRDYVVIVDHIMYWSPTPDKMIVVDEVDEYVIELNKRFHFGEVTYDHWNSKASIQKLRKHGIPARMTPYTRQYKQEIYDNLFQLTISKRLLCPRHKLLETEMKNLQRKWQGNSFKVMPKPDGDCTTDDIVDALAGACFNVRGKATQGLPQGKLISMPVSPQGNNVAWRSMQGTPYGVGSGQKVMNELGKKTRVHPLWHRK